MANVVVQVLPAAAAGMSKVKVVETVELIAALKEVAPPLLEGTMEWGYSKEEGRLKRQTLEGVGEGVAEVFMVVAVWVGVVQLVTVV